MFSSHHREAYSRSLLGRPEGYPLWTPQLNTELRESYQLDGLKIGDVGILSPNNGSFDVLLNITLERDEQPYPERVRGDFTPVPLIPQRDLETQSDAVLPTQCIISSDSIQLTSEHVDGIDQEPSRAHYEFSLSEEAGGILILPQGAESCDLRNEEMFLQEAIRHGVHWYECASDPNTAGRLNLNYNSLYLITGFHKARSWALGATCQAGTNLQGQRSLTFDVGTIRQANVARAYRWAHTHRFLGRVGPWSPYETPPYITGERCRGVNQTVFIRGFRITLNDLLILKTVSVETPQGTFGGLGAYIKNLLWRRSQSTQSPGSGHFTDNTTEQDFRGNGTRLYADTRMTIDHVPDPPKIFHPGDLINRYMLKKEPRAVVAITHDNLWIEILQMGLLELADFSRDECLEEVLTKYYRITVKDSAVYLQRGTGNLPCEHSSMADPSHTTSMGDGVSPTLETMTPGNINIESQSSFTVRDTGVNVTTFDPSIRPTFTEPNFQIDDAALDSWKEDRLEDADTLLTASMSNSHNPNHHFLACRAIVRARMTEWDAALSDAKMAIAIQPSIIGFIAKSLAHVGRGEREEGYQTCDIATELFPLSHSFLLLIKAIVVFIGGDSPTAISRIDDLIAIYPSVSLCYGVQAYMYVLLGESQMRRNDHERAVHSLERARTQLRHDNTSPLFAVSLIFGWKFDNLNFTVRQRLCEALCATGRINESALLLLSTTGILEKEAWANHSDTEWIADFIPRYLLIESAGGVPRTAKQQDETTTPRSTLDSMTTASLLRELVTTSLFSCSWKDILLTAAHLAVPRFTVYRILCERLETTDRIAEASECLVQMFDELAGKENVHEDVTWIPDFNTRYLRRLEDLGDIAMDAGRYHDAISHYSGALALEPPARQDLLMKRSEAYIAEDLWQEAVNDANEVIGLDPSSPWGYQRIHAALHKAGDYDNAIDAFETMLSKMLQSSDPEIRDCYHQYVTPGETKIAIKKAVQEVIRHSPRVLINTASGRLFDKSEQAAAFESHPHFRELISSTTTKIDQAAIMPAVEKYYHYAVLSHKWEDNEPLFNDVIDTVVYDLHESATHDKLKMFCKTVQDADLHWAWSDTCCIDKTDHSVLQEALVSMFKWYESAALTLILLHDIHSPSRRGDLSRSLWNTRAWTLQEYIASKVVRFYNENWTLYRDLEVLNHKDSPDILLEMEEATGISTKALMALKPGLNDIRAKLFIASNRQTTLVEDTAYSLLGIFSMVSPVVYGEGDEAIGRLLAQLLTNSGDASILAWTGRSGSLNSCLPASITVFHDPPTSHIPSAISSAEMERILARTSSLDLESVKELYDRTNEQTVPCFMGQRLKLPCLVFNLGPLSATSSTSGHVFRAKTRILGTVEIRTADDLSRLDSLILVHPWIDFLLDRQPVECVTESRNEVMEDEISIISELQPAIPPTSLAPNLSQVARAVSRLRWSFSAWRISNKHHDGSSLQVSSGERRSETLQFVARLRKPFGALLLTPTRSDAYRRVASDSRVVVQLQEDVPLDKLIESVQVLDVL